MLYTVKYKKVGDFFWSTIKKVKGDYIANDISTKPRVLILEDETRVEIPTEGVVFKFDVNRHLCILKNMEKESRQKVK